MIQDELDRMSRYVDDLLLLVKAPRPDFLRIGPIDLDLFTHDLFAKARSLGDRDWRLDGTGVGLVVADQQRLTQAVMNLASNAVEHTGAGDSIWIGSSMVEGRVRLWVRDEGPGIPPDDQERIFGRYERGNDGGRHRPRALDRRGDRRGARRPRIARLAAGARRHLHDRDPGGAGRGAVSRILIAEDESRLASFLEKGLRSSGFVDHRGQRRDRRRVARPRLGLRPDDPRPEPAAEGRPRRPARPSRSRRAAAGDRAHRPRRPGRPGRGARERRRRLPAEAVPLRGAGGADPGPAPRRRPQPSSRRSLRVGDVALDLRTRWASVGGETVELSAREFELLRDLPPAPEPGAQRASSSWRASGVTTTTRARTWSTSTSATCARSSARRSSRRSAASATGSASNSRRQRGRARAVIRGRCGGRRRGFPPGPRRCSRRSAG